MLNLCKLQMKNLLRTFILLLAVSSLYSQAFNAPKTSSFSGRNFYIGFMQNEIYIDFRNGGLQLRVFVTAVLPTKFEVRIPGYETVVDSLGENGIKEIVVQYPIEVRTSEVPLPRAIQVVADLPVSVYAFSSQLTTSESYTAIPVSRWGKEYIVMSYPNDQYDDPERWNLDSLERFEPRSSQFMVIAAYDSTVISFRPRAVTKGGKQVNQTYNVVLNQGEVYLVQSFKAERGQADLTGTIVRGNKPFGLLSGHVRTSVPQTNRYPFDSKDHLVEMLPPTDTWGKYYCSVPFGVNNRGDLFRIASINPGTVVTLTTPSLGTRDFFLGNTADFVEVSEVNEAAVWQSNHPIQIVQYMQHTGDANDSKEYDPCIVVLPPVEQYVQNIVFLTPTNFQIRDQYREHRVAIVADAEALDDLKYDGALVRQLDNILARPIAGTPFYYGSLLVREGRHHLTSSRGRFSGILYAFGFHDAYAMALGNSLTNPFKEDSIAPRIFVNEKCGFIDGFVTDIYDTNSTGIDYGRVVTSRTNNYIWNFPAISDTATVARFTARPVDIHKNGRFEIEFIDKNSNAIRYVYEYKGFSIDIPKETQFPNISWANKACREFEIKNTGNKIIRLDSAVIKADKRLSYTSSRNLPTGFAPGETIKFELCFDPQGDSTLLNSSILFYFECDYTSGMSIKGNVLSPAIEVTGYDFGEVLVGDTKCNNIKIENLGNTNLIIDRFIFSLIFPEFDFRTTAILPLLLRTGESKEIQVCFTPSQVGLYETKVNANNDYDLFNEFIVLGKGVAPDVNSISLNWGPKRIGTQNDTTLYLRNSGSHFANVMFQTFISGSQSDENGNLLASIDTVLEIDEEMPLQLNYHPINTNDYLIEANYITNWSLHRPINIKVTGRGTIPEIKTFDFRFDTTRVFYEIDSLVLAIRAGGNELLTIDDITIAGGDVESFDLNLNIHNNTRLLIGEELILPIKFQPQRIGEHTLLLAVRHDANPNYERSVDTIKISGFAIPADTIDYLINFAFPQIFACISEQGYLEITNTGNIDINIQKFDTRKVPDNFKADFREDIQSLLPILLNPCQSRRFDMDFYAERGQGGEIVFELQINDSINRNISHVIEPIVTEIELDVTPLLEAVPGDTVLLRISGEFPIGVEPNVDVRFELALDSYFAELITRNGTLKLIGETQTRNLPIRFTQNRHKILFNFGADSLNIFEKTNWELELVFLILLHDKDATELTFEAITGRCHKEAAKNISLNILGVCNFPLRPIKIIANLPFVNVAPNPIINRISVEINMTNDEDVSLSLIDALGRHIDLDSNLSLGVGRHKLNYSTDGLNSGVYNLIVWTKDWKDNFIFVITK